MQNGAKMAVRIIAGFLVLALVAGLVVMAVSAAEDTSFAAGDSNYQLTKDVDSIVIDHDMCLDLNGFQATHVTVNEGVTLQLVDSANDQYEAEKCGSLSGTINGTVEQLVKRDTKNYLVICQDGVYSAHRFYAGITDISLVPGTVSLGYKAFFKTDSVIGELVSGYGYALRVNDLPAKQYFTEGKIVKDVLTLRLNNILSDNEAMNQIGATAQIYGNAVISFDLDGQNVTASGAEHDTTLCEAVEAVNSALGNDRTAYGASQIEAVRNMYNTYNAYMTQWDVEYILSEDKFVAQNVTAVYGETLTLGELFAAVDGATIGDVTVTVEGVVYAYTPNTDWNLAAITFQGIGKASVTITDNNLCWATTNTFEIGKATIDAPVVNTLNATYGQSLSEISLPQGFSWVDATASVGNAGTQTHTATYNAGENYNPVEVTVTVEVAKADTTAPAVDTLNATYGQSLSAISLPQGFSWVDATASVGNAGTQTHTATYNAGENYNPVEVTVTVEVAKIDPTYTIPAGLEATEGEALSTITLPAGFAWVDGNETVTLEKSEYAATYSNGNDNYNTVNLEIPVAVEPAIDPDKFAQKMPAAEFTYRLGNGNSVSLSSIFAANEGAKIDSASVNVTVSALDDCVVSGAYTANTSDWTKGTLKFEGTGLVEITIKDATSNEFSLTFEIVNANNATGASSATANNVVLLNNVGFSTLTVSNGYTLFGNGFTMTATSEAYADSFGDCFLSLDNGTLDNVRIQVPFFAYSFLYNKQAKEESAVAGPYDGTYYNMRSAVYMTGNSKILNSYISGGRAAVYAPSGNPVFENTTIYGGSAANIHVGSVQSVTMRDMTMVQMPIEGTVNGNEDSTRTAMGFGVLIECDGEGNSAPLILEGELKQFAWFCEDYKTYVPADASKILTAVLNKSDFIHQITVGEKSGKWMNLGIAYAYLDGQVVPKTPSITDNRTDKAAKPYSGTTVEALIRAYVYSYNNSKRGIGETEQIPGENAVTSNGVTVPVIAFNDQGIGKTFETKFDTTNGWMSTLTVDLDTTGDYTFNFANLVASKYGKNLTYTVKDAAGNAVGATVALTDSGAREYILNIVDDVDCNGSVIHSYHFKLTATKTSIQPPVKVAEPGGTALLVVKSYGSDWSCAIPALEETQIKYYNKSSGAYETLALSSLTPSSTGKQNETNNYWNYSDPNGNFTLKVTCGVIHDTKKVYGMPVVVNNSGNKMYFTISSTNGYVSTSTASRTVTISYEFTDGNGQTLTFSKTWQFNYADYKDVAQYKYSDFVNGKLTQESGSSGGGCVTPDTLVTLADGSQVRVDSLTGSEQLLVWNMETGMLDTAPIMFVDAESAEQTNVITLYFSDGTDVKVVYEHGFWDYDLNRYVYLDEKAADYIGHTFAKQDGESLSKVQLVDVVIESQITEAWSPVTAGHLCYFVNGMLSMPGGVGGLFNIFEVNPETMTYDYEAMARDIETYGLFTYEEMNSIVELPEEMFEAAGGAFLKISMGKGNLTMDELIAMIVRYTKYF